MVIRLSKAIGKAGVEKSPLRRTPVLLLGVVNENRAFRAVVVPVPVYVGLDPPEVGQHSLEAPLIVAQ